MDMREVVITEAKNAGLKVVTAESLTGGMLASSLIQIPGASAAVLGGYVAYSDQMKAKMLGVKEGTLSKFGAISKETAYEMALGALKNSGADVAVSLTGNAGPTAVEGKPVGKVFMCIVVDKRAYDYELQFAENERNMLRISVVGKAVEELGRRLLSLSVKRRRQSRNA